MAKPMRPNIPPMNEEQKKEAMVRAFAQKRAALAEGILFNLCQNPVIFKTDVPLTIGGIDAVKAANDMATEFMKVVYGQEITFKED